MAGAYISHFGIALLIFGVITTSQYSETHHVVLTQGVPVDVAGYTLTFEGKEQVEKHFKDREKFRYHVHIEGQGEDRTVAAVLYWSDYNRRQSAFLEPGIRWGVMNDLYISPKATEEEDVWNTITVMRGTSFENALIEGQDIRLQRFSTPLEEDPTEDGRMQMGAVLELEGSDGEITEFKAITRISTGGPDGMSFDPVWTDIPGTTSAIALTRITRNNDDPTKSTGQFAFRSTTEPMPTPREIFTIDFSIKPLISLVWIGVITMVLGFAFSIVRYVRMPPATSKPIDE